jgi:hypothetical protein
MALKAHRIVIEPTSIRGERGQRYRVHHEGVVLLEDCWNPELEACRVLTERGINGRLEVWRSGAKVDRPPGLSISGGRGPHLNRLPGHDHPRHCQGGGSNGGGE